MSANYNPSGSRLSRRLESKSKKSLIINIVGIIVVIFLLVKFAIPFLVNATLFVFGNKTDKITASKEENSFVPPPILNSMPEATNSASINVSGSSINSDTVSLFVNDDLVDETKPEKNGKFSFDITLSEKQNSIKAQSSSNGNKSDLSNILNVSYLNSPPSLNIDSPADGQSFSKDQDTAEVTGTTDSLTRVTVNGFWAIIDRQHHFSYNLPLKEGDNTIDIVASDEAGNQAKKTIKATYSR